MLPNNATQNSTTFRTANQFTRAEPKAIPHTTRGGGMPVFNRTKTNVIPRSLHTCHSMRNPILIFVGSPQISMSFRTLTEFFPSSTIGSCAWRPKQRRNGSRVSWQIHFKPKKRSVFIGPKASGNNTAEFSAPGGITLVLFGMSLEFARNDLGFCPETDRLWALCG